jgi:hypothetical protein
VPRFTAAGDGNTPHVGEGYYRVPPCGALAHKIFGLPTKAEKSSSKQKLKDTLRYQPLPVKWLKTGVTLSVLMHEETENKCPSVSLERASNLFRSNSEASSKTSTLTCGSDAFLFDKYRSRNLVPYHPTRGSYAPKKATTSQNWQACM